MTRIFLSLLALAALSACATRPESISASFVSHEKYMGKDCTQLSTVMGDARAKLAEVSAAQNTKANIDAATVFIALIPASKLTGDRAGEVAQWKGEVEAISTAQIKRNCKTS